MKNITLISVHSMHACGQKKIHYFLEFNTSSVLCPDFSREVSISSQPMQGPCGVPLSGMAVPGGFPGAKLTDGDGDKRPTARLRGGATLSRSADEKPR